MLLFVCASAPRRYLCFKQPNVIQSSRFILHRFDDQGIGNFMEKKLPSSALSKCYSFMPVARGMTASVPERVQKQCVEVNLPCLQQYNLCKSLRKEG